MARTHDKTKTTSGAHSVTVSKDLSNDLQDFLDAAMAETEKQSGEVTTNDIARRYGKTIEQAHNFLEKQVNRGKMTRRPISGRCVYYRLADVPSKGQRPPEGG